MLSFTWLWDIYDCHLLVLLSFIIEILTQFPNVNLFSQVILAAKTDSRLANNNLPADIQKLRCRACYEALCFAPQIEAMGKVKIWFLYVQWLFNVILTYMVTVVVGGPHEIIWHLHCSALTIWEGHSCLHWMHTWFISWWSRWTKKDQVILLQLCDSEFN
jgi:hypothetical protein